MATWLKYGTAANVPVGPLVDTDGAEVTGATVAQAEVRLSKNGATFAQKASSSDCAHMEYGWYQVDLTSDDTSTLGSLIVNINDGGAMQAWREFMVVPANVYDSLITDTDYLQTDPLAQVAYGTYTIGDLFKFMSAALAGGSGGGGTATLTFTLPGDSDTTVISATVDSDGNRTGMSLST